MPFHPFNRSPTVTPESAAPRPRKLRPLFGAAYFPDFPKIAVIRYGHAERGAAGVESVSLPGCTLRLRSAVNYRPAARRPLRLCSSKEAKSAVRRSLRGLK